VDLPPLSIAKERHPAWPHYRRQGIYSTNRNFKQAFVVSRKVPKNLLRDQSFLIIRLTRLYEQAPGEPFDSARLGDDVSRWISWVGWWKAAYRRIPSTLIRMLPA